MKKNGLKIILGVIGILLITLAFFINKDIQQEEILRKTIQNYIDEQIVPEETSTTGEYAKIENEILNYLTKSDQYTEELTTIFKDIYDFEFYYATNASESLKDNFANDKNKLIKLEQELNNKLDQFIELNNYENLLNNYKNTESYYNDLYIELLGDKEGFTQTLGIYTNFKTTYEEYFIIANKYIDFLKESTLTIDNIEENMMFDTDEEILAYEKLAEELNLSLTKIVAIN